MIEGFDVFQIASKLSAFFAPNQNRVESQLLMFVAKLILGGSMIK